MRVFLFRQLFVSIYCLYQNEDEKQKTPINTENHPQKQYCTYIKKQQ